MMLEHAMSILDGLVDLVPRSHGQIRLDLTGPVARLHVDHPEARNALTAGMMRQLADAVDRLGRSDAIVVVLSSAEGGAFCAGGHLREVQAALGTPENGQHMALAMAAVLDAFSNLPVVSVAALEGRAIGGGAELAMSADFRVLGKDAGIHFVHTRLGVVPGWGGAGRLVDRMGRQSALAVLLDANPLDAQICEQLGLADELVPSGMALASALARADRVARRGAAARAAKMAVVARSTRTDGQREREATAFASVWGSEGHQAALEHVLRRLS